MPHIQTIINNLQEMQVLTNPQQVLLDALQTRLTSNEINILITGDFNRGKSSLLNVLAGQDMFYTSPISSPIINTLQPSKFTTISATDKDGQRLEIEVGDLSTFYPDQSDEITQVDVTMALQNLPDNIRIIEYPILADTPMNASQRDHYFQTADLVIFVLAADALLSHSERDTIKQLLFPMGHQKILYVCNFMDRIKESEVDDLRAHAQRTIPAQEATDIVFMSTQAALDARDNNDNPLGAASGALALSEQINTLISDPQTLKETRARYVLQHLVETVDRSYQQAQSLQTEQKAELTNQQQKLQQSLNDLKNIQTQALKSLADFRRRIREIVTLQTVNKIKSLANQIEDWAVTYEGNNLVDDLLERAKQDLKYWQANEIEPLLRQRMQSQNDVFRHETQRFRMQVQLIYKQMGANASYLSERPYLDLSIPDLAPPQFNIHVADQEKLNKGFVDLFETTDLAITAAGTIIASFFVGPLLAIPMGVGLFAWTQFNRDDAPEKLEAVKPSTSHLRERSENIAKQLTDVVDEKVAEIEMTVSQYLDNLMTSIEQEMQMYITSQEQQNDQISQLDLEKWAALKAQIQK